MKYLYTQLLDLAKPCSRIRTQMASPEGQNVRGGGSYMWNEKDGLARKTEKGRRDPSGCSISQGSSSVLREPQRRWMIFNHKDGVINENLGKHEKMVIASIGWKSEVAWERRPAGARAGKRH